MFTKTLINAIDSAWPMLTIFIVVVVSLRLASFANSAKKICLYEELLDLFFIIYILLLFELLTGTENTNGSGMNLVPFTEILRYDVGSNLFYYNVIGNILMFVPFGFFASRYTKTKKMWPIFVLSLITSLTIELVQLQIGRSFDIDDIILNVVGGMSGYLLFVGLKAIKNHLPSFLQKDFIYNLICIIIIAALVIYYLKFKGMWWF